ncbi:MAG: hypothetical protein R3314_07115 [Longimicrobiales bacterium]|nr:hypothetical protein [Longimicrobiales bacterium]
MVPVLSLWLPILLSAVLVFIMSSIIHMLLSYHWTDWSPVPREDDVMEALRGVDISPGNYSIPHAASMAAMKEPEYVEKRERGPVAMITVMPSGQGGMGKQLTLWFLYSIVVSVFAAYVTGRAVGPGAEYLEVFRFSATAAFLAYGVGEWQQSIWWGRSWTTTLKNTIDGLIYAFLTAGAFGWLWPAM